MPGDVHDFYSLRNKGGNHDDSIAMVVVFGCPLGITKKHKHAFLLSKEHLKTRDGAKNFGPIFEAFRLNVLVPSCHNESYSL